VAVCTNPYGATRFAARGGVHVGGHAYGRELLLATRDTIEERGVRMSPARVARVDETKPSFLSTEFWVFVLAVAGILVAASQADNLDADRAWTLIAAVAIGYMVSRGLAKAGSAHRDRDRGDES
jgi:hypothetical protein